MRKYAPYINIHTHKANAHGSVVSVLNLMVGEPGMEKLSNFYSLGIHPWQLQSADNASIIDLIHNIKPIEF